VRVAEARENPSLEEYRRETYYGEVSKVNACVEVGVEVCVEVGCTCIIRKF